MSDAARRARIAIAAALVVVAAGWALSDIQPRGPHLITLWPGHGIDAYDLWALVPLAVTAVLL